ncbi:MAG TPA: AMIN domain-containing protein [Blastocatellia bacterium]|nr:AMIN domain-containing protein [Blastocatellia bacterium]
MKTALRISALALALLLTASLTGAQSTSQFGNIAERQRTSTVLGGTGLFNTFSTRTLYKGEFNFALFWNNFDRDPGALDINQVPFNITVGLTDRWELWVDWVTWQQTTSRQPFLLSGYSYNAVRQFGSPFDILGPPVGGRNGAAAFFPGTGSLVGGILPALGRFGQPIDFPSGAFSPGGSNASLVRGLGPLFSTVYPNYNPEFPFFGEVDFQGFDALGRPVFGPRESSNGSGDVTVGTKVSLIDANKHWFSMALGGYLKIPISSSDDARARGRTSGEFEFGPTLILGQELLDHRLRFYENVGYIHTTDIHQRGVKVLDLRDKLQLNVGGAMAINKYIELVGELAGTVYVGGGTPSLQQSNPLDLNLGARFYFRDGSIAFGGAYRRQLNGLGSRALDALECMEVPQEPPDDDCHGGWHAQGGEHHPCPPKPPMPPKIECKQRQVRFNGGDKNGFVGFLSVGTRKGCPPPPVPVCVIESSSRAVTRGERLTLSVKPSIPGYPDSQVAYDFRWEIRDARGNSVWTTGTGSVVEVPTDRLECGNYTVLATVTATAKGVEHPDCPDRTAQSNCSVAFELTEAPCPNITCNIIASNTSVVEGDRVTLRATGTGDSNFSYAWTTTGGRLSSTTGREVTLNTTGVIGPITATVRLMPDRTRCGEPCPGGSCSLTITAREVPPPPTRPRILVPCGPIFFPFNSARINNEHKACLDEVAIEMQQDPRSTVVVDGHRDSAERVGISLTRANNARDYLVTEKGIDAARITVRNYGDTCPFTSGDRKLNGRVEFWIIPEGATIEDINAVKKCAVGASPRVITNEQPAPAGAPRRTPRRRSGRPEPLADADEDDAETDDAPPADALVQTTAPPKAQASPPRNDSTMGKATVVQSVSAQAVNGGVRITIKTDGAAAYQDFTLSNPSRIVIDISGVRWAGISQALGQSIGVVAHVRIGEPQAGTVRVVLDMKSPVGYRVSRNGSVIVIAIGEGAIAATAKD